MKRHCILVTNGEQRSSLAVVRSLGKNGHRVLVAAYRRGSLSGASRYAASETVVPAASKDVVGFVDAIASACTREQVDVIVPTTDESLLALLPARTRLAPAMLPVGSEAAYRAASDKALLQSIAPQFGIAVPRQIVLSSPSDDCATAVQFPVVVKPSQSVSVGAGIRRHFTTRYANDAAELRAILSEAPSDSYPLLVQERIVGYGLGIFLLLWQGRELAVFGHRRVREMPPGGGVSVCAESIEPDPDLVARSRALLTHLGFEGVAMVEYKIKGDTGVPYLMEVNGRFWGSLQLAIDAGVDFPQLLIAAAVDGETPAAPKAISGIRTRWWWGDVDHLLTRFRRSRRELALPADAPSRWRVMVDFMTGGGPSQNQVLRLDDPRPAVRETLNWFARR